MIGTAASEKTFSDQDGNAYLGRERQIRAEELREVLTRSAAHEDSERKDAILAIRLREKQSIVSFQAEQQKLEDDRTQLQRIERREEHMTLFNVQEIQGQNVMNT
jgi:hypothetical protein